MSLCAMVICEAQPSTSLVAPDGSVGVPVCKKCAEEQKDLFDDGSNWHCRVRLETLFKPSVRRSSTQRIFATVGLPLIALAICAVSFL